MVVRPNIVEELLETPRGIAEVEEIAEEMRTSRARISAIDPEAYAGYVTDVACRAVGKRRDMRPVDVLRAFRAVHPNPVRGFPNIPADAKLPSDKAKAAA